MNEFTLDGFSEEEKQILKERARKLALKTEVLEQDLSEFLVCAISNELYGFSTNYIQEVFIFNEITKLPSCPNWLLGIINLRGEIISIINIREFFDLKTPDNTNNYKALILQKNDIKFGILIDMVSNIIAVDESKLVKDFATFDDIRKNYLLGITEEREVILDADKILSDPGLIINNEF